MEHPPIEPDQPQELTQEQLSELLQIRRDKLSALQEAGSDPFANTTYDVSHHSADILAAERPQELIRRRGLVGRAGPIRNDAASFRGRELIESTDTRRSRHLSLSPQKTGRSPY